MAFASGTTSMGSSESKQSRHSERTTYEAALGCETRSECGVGLTTNAGPSRAVICPGSQAQIQAQLQGRNWRKFSNLRRSLSGGSLALDDILKEGGALGLERTNKSSDALPETKKEWMALQKGKGQVRAGRHVGGPSIRDRPGSPNSVLLEALALESGSTSFDSSEGDPSVTDSVESVLPAPTNDYGQTKAGRGSVPHRREIEVLSEEGRVEIRPKRQAGPVAGKELVQLLQEYLEQNPDREDTVVSPRTCELLAPGDDKSEPCASLSDSRAETGVVLGKSVKLPERTCSMGEDAGCSRPRVEGEEGRIGDKQSGVGSSRRHGYDGTPRRGVAPLAERHDRPSSRRNSFAESRRDSFASERSEKLSSSERMNVENRMLAQAGAAALFSKSTKERRVSRSSESVASDTEGSEIACSGPLSGNLGRSISLSLGKGSKSPVVACSIPYRELQTATNNFAHCNLLGNGGFGPVHKGLLGGFIPVAVKQLWHGSSQGDDEFRAEVEVLGRLRHKNVVPLVGYCVAEEKRLLVYEYAPHGCLHRALHDTAGTRPALEWPLRWRIAVGIANGICYLHSGCSFGKVVHLDIRSSNILLQKNYSPMVADFGLARFVTGQASDFVSHVKGTFGYIDPEYATTGCLTEKSDVYAFGVVLLELMSGRKALDTKYPTKEQCLVHWANKHISRKMLGKLADPRLGGHYNQRQFKRMLDVVAQCIQPKGIDRPTMRQALTYFETGHWTMDPGQRSVPQSDMSWAFRASPLLSFKRSNSLA